jgi:hypothetical protein
VAASTRHISHSSHAHLGCIKCNIVTVIQRWRSRPGKIPWHQQPATPRTSSPPGTTYPRPPNRVLHLMQLSPELEPRDSAPAAPSPSPPGRKAGNEVEPPAVLRVAASGSRLRHPRPAPVGDLDPDNAVQRLDRDAAGYWRKARSLATQPRPRSCDRGLAPPLRTRGRPAPGPPVPQASRSPGPFAQPSAHPPSRPPRPREIAGRRAAHADARSTRGQTSS